MTEKISEWLTTVFSIGVILVGLSTLFLFTNLTTEFYETPKFLSLSLFVAILLILTTLKFIGEGKVALRSTPLDLPLLGILVLGIISTFVAPGKYISFLGNPPVINGSLLGWIIYILLYFLLVNNLRRIKDVKPVITTLVLGGAGLGVLALLSYAGIKVFPMTWAGATNFTPTGGSFATAAVLTLLLPFPLLNLIREANPAEKLVNLIITTIYSVTILLIGSLATYVGAIFALGIVLIVSRKNLKSMQSLSSLFIPAIIVIVVGVLSFVSVGKANPIYDLSLNFPREVQLPLSTSWYISTSAFRDSPFIGTGPATYIFNFTTYKPLEFNSTQFWNIRFDSAFNEYLQVLATLGGVGLGLLLLLTLVYVTSSSKILNQYKLSGENSFEASLGIAGLVFFVLLALHASTLVMMVIGIIILASFMGTNPNNNHEIRIKFGAIKASGAEGVSLDVFPAVLLLAILVLVAFGSFFVGKFALADFAHRKALEAVAANNGIETYNQLVKAEALNPYNDLYRTDLAQTNFALANAIASAKGPTQSSPSGSLTDQDRQNIQTLLQQSINEGRNATTISPRSANNWEILGNIYRQISGVAQNALQFSLDSYGRAIQLDPLNPQLRLNVGGIYYSIKNYEMAVRFFTDAANLKPDFANAYYNLSIALRDKGDLTNAQATAEKLVSLVDPKSTDYPTAAAYLKDLKDRIATGSAAQSNITPPAAEQTSPLQTNQKDKVLNLPQPENIATPPAVKK
ncbi:MAG: O-antigen ligase family protein [Candidatus Daviesbacteria bacterium]|nr:O-antigen ligase family protein [Candidatus Daviesbacteria bacterium]